MNDQSLATFEQFTTSFETTIQDDFNYASEKVQILAEIIEGIDVASNDLDNTASSLASSLRTFKPFQKEWLFFLKVGVTKYCHRSLM